MNNLQTFSFNSQPVRTVQLNNQHYWVLKDVCDVLELSNPTVVANRLEDDERAKFNLGRQGEATVITESGLYAVILRSDKPNAKEFRKWVTSEVLPAIRKNGVYLTDEKAYDITHNPQSLADLLMKAGEQLKQKEIIIQEMKPKALFADAVAASNSNILIGDLAKLIKQNGHDIGQKRLFDWLRDNGYLIKYGSSRNMPTQLAMNLGLFKVKESTFSNPDGSVRITRTTKVTGKGQQYFINKFLGS
ncbi:phage antirepressor KilAC domain-containing protein [Solobacterium moorei]|uniref:phage antirepressor KilAC domain-containing protein n=1 Tax=Solobacterium moorei TaxID=102148 RepID=UPI00040E4F05|nr:phage antirepressor KilAC domain-containing protein [Solobacterium moorei]BET22526.1 phage antirepressor Ant [Solobacterium moorei]